MDFARAAAALKCAGGEIAGAFSSVCIDSRKVSRGALFVALTGDKTDGHRFVEQAFQRGAAGVLVERDKAAAYRLAEIAAARGVPLLSVENTLSGLQTLAAVYSDNFPNLLRIGLTGSSGKTTTKEIAIAMCAAEKRVIGNEGNLNSETGLPLSLFTIREEHEIGIFEMGMNKRGEISSLAHILRPKIALITNIGSAHIGCLGSVQEIALEKKAIFSEFTGCETALIGKDSDFAALLAKDVRGKVVFWGESCAARLPAQSRGLHGWEIDWKGVKVNFPLPGIHNLRNAFAAAAIAAEAGVTDDAIRAGFTAARALFGRGEILEGDVTVVRDCYNANPESAAAAIDMCDGVSWQGRRIYVLGSMLELGDESERRHGELAEKLARSRADYVFLYGAEMAGAFSALQAAHSGKNLYYTNDIDELRELLQRTAVKGTLVLLKGSRGCALERAWD
ncbi:MAG: UDP-N-acetylmuramoyl-tripeptide--D-alanyl-D-alanine ligase [Spirochaetaceae bacterium]|nr:UDP-N-acetylmuramoyl-tripeptide--D-alanyl-D-alanine ligase [Spirochaetaceae bacterium]